MREKNNKRAMTKERNQQMLEDYIAGMSVKAISEKYKLCVNRCYNILRQQGYDGYRHNAEMVKDGFSTRNQQIINDYMNGVSAIELAKKHGITRSRIYMILGAAENYESHREAGFVNKHQKEINERNTLIINEVLKNPMTTIASIATKYNISAGHAYEILHREGIYRSRMLHEEGNQ